MKYHYKRGDRVRIISKTIGESLSSVKLREGSEWQNTGWIRRCDESYYVVSYIPLDDSNFGGDFYKEKDLVLYNEDLPDELFDL
jgi:hypothetical protein